MFLLRKSKMLCGLVLITEKHAMSLCHRASNFNHGESPDILSMVSTNTTSLSASVWYWAWLPGQEKLLQVLLGPGNWNFSAFLHHSGPIIKTQLNRSKILDINSSCNHNLMLRKWECKEEFAESFHLFLTWYFLLLIVQHTVQQQFWLHKSVVCCS